MKKACRFEVHQMIVGRREYLLLSKFLIQIVYLLMWLLHVQKARDSQMAFSRPEYYIEKCHE